MNRILTMLPYDESSTYGQHLRFCLRLAALLYEHDKSDLSNAVRKGYRQLAQMLDLDDFLSVIKTYLKGGYTPPSGEVNYVIVFDNPDDLREYIKYFPAEWSKGGFGTLLVMDYDLYEVDPVNFGAREDRMVHYHLRELVLLFHMIFRAEDAGLPWAVDSRGSLILPRELE